MSFQVVVSSGVRVACSESLGAARAADKEFAVYPVDVPPEVSPRDECFGAVVLGASEGSAHIGSGSPERCLVECEFVRVMSC